jgi:mono/diheme cytochrome c family protein
VTRRHFGTILHARRAAPFVAAAILLAPVTLSPEVRAAAWQETAGDVPAIGQRAHRAVLDRYCVTCHNERMKVPAASPLRLDVMDLAQVEAGAEAWEKVVRKLRAGAMPPAGSPRPPAAQLDALASWLEEALDAAAERNPNPGRVPAFHRLTRTEYRNAVRDLLALDDLPRELDIELLLPVDNTVGFDTVAEALFVTPTLMEGYLTAARKLSALAMGDPSMPLIVDTYRPGLELPQDDHVAELPLGTRGGLSIRRYFPLDGDYAFRVELAGPAREPHDLEISLDGDRVALFTVGGPRPPSDGYGTGGGRVLEARLPVRAGPRSVAVTFVKRTSAYIESITRPYRRGRGQQPAIGAVTISGPYAAVGAADTPARRRLLICRPETPQEEEPCAEAILSGLVRRAFRRPATPDDIEALLPFYRAGRDEGSFETGIQRLVERVLVSPEFLFRIEDRPRDVPAGAAYRITDLELASRLSFFLWSSIPDDELLDVAEAGRLREPDVLERQVVRMLADARSRALVTNFAAQWLYLRDLPARRPNDRLFPDFDDGLRQAFVRETELFFEAIVREDRPVLELLSADYTFVNERLARHYGIPYVYGSDFRRITLPEGSPRGGLLGQGSILTLTSYATRTSPVVRGKWILENILGSPPPPPPPNVPALKAENAQGKVLSMRERMVQHRANPVCASCHARMDPLGFALETFDAVGRWRTHGESGAPVDASGTLPDGTTFDGVAGLRRALLAAPGQFVTTLTEKLLTYAIGRELGYHDAPAVRTITRQALARGARFSGIVIGIVESRPFQMRRSES